MLCKTILESILSVEHNSREVRFLEAKSFSILSSNSRAGAVLFFFAVQTEQIPQALEESSPKYLRIAKAI